MRMRIVIFHMRFSGLFSLFLGASAFKDAANLADLAEAFELLSVAEASAAANQFIGQQTTACMRLKKDGDCAREDCTWCDAIKIKGALTDPSGCVDESYAKLLQSTGRYFCRLDDYEVTSQCNSIKKKDECQYGKNVAAGIFNTDCVWCDHPKGFGGCFTAYKQVRAIAGFRQICDVRDPEREDTPIEKTIHTLNNAKNVVKGRVNEIYQTGLETLRPVDDDELME
eukprot:GDKJ01042687.1.p1 GENE.GDKJ01042687.1~~GDKJ01042687.1.p1  ORF type:complete len:226 (-),score=56.79 GDKJ01042687.1:672-1349(-)